MAEEEKTEATSNAVRSEESLANLIELLDSPRRRQRQEASHLIAEIAKKSPEQLAKHADALIDALYRPEAQTRWECFDTLSCITSVDPDVAEGAYDGAEASLFDESSAAVRLAAFQFLARLGASSPERSDRVWPLLDEAVQCYHGDPEYRDMLKALVEFAEGSISDRARESMIERVTFDAQNGSGYVKTLSQDIINAAKAEE